MHPQAPALVQHGSPRGKHALVHVEPPHDVLGAGLRGGVMPLPGLGLAPVPGSVEPPELDDSLPATHEPKLQTEFVAVQSVQAAAACPHAVSSFPPAHVPFAQHPWQVFGSQVAGAALPLPPLASSPLISGGVLRPGLPAPTLLSLATLASVVPPPSSTAPKPTLSVPRPMRSRPGRPWRTRRR